MHSIRRFLLLFLISALTLVIFNASLKGYRETLKVVSENTDQNLKAWMTNLMAWNSQDIDSATQQSSLAIQIWRDNELLFSSGHIHGQLLGTFVRGYSTRNFAGQRWRVLTEAGDHNTWFVVAQPMTVQRRLIESMTLASIGPYIFIIPIVAIILYWAVTTGLKPLKELSVGLSKRHIQDLSPIHPSSEVNELSHVIKTINQLLSRLKASFEREQHFTSNAAHELRTPLSVLKLNLHNLDLETHGQFETVKKLQIDTDRMIHVVNQILTLSRTNPDHFLSHLSCIRLQPLAQRVISDHYGAIIKKNQSIELDSEEVEIESTEFAMYTLLSNLLTNAIKYTPQDASIKVLVKVENSCPQITVENAGNALSDAEMSKILERFYRAKDHLRYEGSGLGLAIVSQIVALHHGKLTTFRSELGGLGVRIWFGAKATK